MERYSPMIVGWRINEGNGTILFKTNVKLTGMTYERMLFEFRNNRNLRDLSFSRLPIVYKGDSIKKNQRDGSVEIILRY